jgi:hypothetical protein
MARCLGGTWTVGLCDLLATSLSLFLGGEMYTITDRRNGAGVHVALRVGGWFIDGDGLTATSQDLLERWGERLQHKTPKGELWLAPWNGDKHIGGMELFWNYYPYRELCEFLKQSLDRKQVLSLLTV